MNLYDDKSFEKACGKMMHLRRNMSTFKETWGQVFRYYIYDRE